jgi:hypothetical protein
MPKGWVYHSKIVLSQMDQQWLSSVVDEARQTVSPQQALQVKSTIDATLQSGVFNLLPRVLVPALGNYSKKSAAGQNTVNLARTAIALERYRLVHGEYPEALDALAPQFMAQVPHDVIGGQPLKYRREADGRFVLYSVGWNEKDDGGTVALKDFLPSDMSPAVTSPDEGDWVWQYPAK